MIGNIKKILITGSAGFVGSHAVDYFLKRKFFILGIDNLSTGKKHFLVNALKNDNFKFIKEDLSNFKKICKYFKNIDLVIHLSANADVRNGPTNPKIDLKQNLLVY